MKVLVTGSSGRLGSFVVRGLAEAGHELSLFSRRQPDPALGDWPWARGDIANYEDCLRAMEPGFDAVQHLAAQPYPTDHPEQRQRSQELGLPLDTTMRSNIMGTYYLLEAAVLAGVKTFVMTGSNCALGHGYRISGDPFPFQYLPVDEAHPLFVEDSYSYSKLAGELMLAAYSRAYGLRAYAVRAAGICNEARRRNMAETAKPATAWNPWVWAWVGSEDVASAHRLLMEKAEGIAPYGAFFCNSDDTTALEPSLELVTRFQLELAPLAQGMAGHATFLSNQKLKEAVGWEHRTSWRQYL